MIYIDKGELNKIVLTLNESATLVNPFYLFVFENEFDTATSPIEIYLANISTSTNRYDLFELTEGTDLTLVKGQYTYSVYESATEPATITDTTQIAVEEGRMVVGSDSVTFNTIYD